MLTYLRNSQILLLIVSLAYPFTKANANGDFVEAKEPPAKYNAASEPKEKASAPIAKKVKKRKTQRTKNPQIQCRICCSHPCCCTIVKKRKCPKIKVTTLPRPVHSTCKDRKEFGFCPNFPIRRILCEIINPADIVDSNCGEFIKKLQTCEAYTCFAPYTQDPTIRTKWQIHGKNGNRCIVSNTTDDIGLKDPDGNPIPVTQMCEYDQRGIRGLIERFNDQKERYYHFLTCDRFEGIHNCNINSRGRTLKEVMHNPTPEIDMPLPPSGG
jgi:hypothetical protein